jgi:hypothetical protein
MPKIISTSTPAGATPAARATANSTDTYPSDHVKATLGGGGTK